MRIERRHGARRSPVLREYILFSNGRGHRFLCPLQDVSPCGMMVTMPGCLGLGLRVEDSITVDDCPPQLRIVLRNVSGSVVWANDSSCGIAFSAPLGITCGELSSLLAGSWPCATDLAH